MQGGKATHSQVLPSIKEAQPLQRLYFCKGGAREDALELNPDAAAAHAAKVTKKKVKRAAKIAGGKDNNADTEAGTPRQKPPAALVVPEPLYDNQKETIKACVHTAKIKAFEAQQAIWQLWEDLLDKNLVTV